MPAVDVALLREQLSLRELAEAADVDFILAMFVDMLGKPCAKLVPVEAADELQAGALGFAGFAAGLIGQAPHDPDLLAVPDLATFSPLDTIRPGLAVVHCDPHVGGEPWPYSPRVILKRAIARLAETGLTPMVGAEVEYFLVHQKDGGGISVADPRDRAARGCYDARGVTRMYDHLTATSRLMNHLGWGNYANDHEDGAGQFEQNFAFADALTTADRVITLRYAIHMLAERGGMTATFMPKPFTDLAGNGMHLHLSLWRGSEPAFPATSDDERGLGLSPLAYSFIGGLLEHAPALSAFLAPTVNSYKRRGARTTTSGATWSPSRATYGGNDRTHLVRVPDGNRVELRGGDGSANPYLAIAASLVAGLDGISRGADPGSPCVAGGTREDALELPVTLLHAVAALRADPTLLDDLGDSPAIGNYYADDREREFIAWHNVVTEWEIQNYLTAF